MSDDASKGPSKARPDAVLALTIVYHPDISRVGERAYLDGASHEVDRCEVSPQVRIAELGWEDN